MEPIYLIKNQEKNENYTILSRETIKQWFKNLSLREISAMLYLSTFPNKKTFVLYSNEADNSIFTELANKGYARKVGDNIQIRLDNERGWE